MSLTFKAIGGSVPPGEYRAVLACVEERTGSYGAYLLWKFGIQHDGQEAIVTARSSTTFSIGTKPRRFAEVLLGRAYADGEDIDLEALYGAACQVVVTIEEREDGSFTNLVERVLPLRQDKSADPVPF
jgi:hypothetical protein